MGIIVVSRMYGAGGTTFAKRLAQCLNYQYADKEFINKLIQGKEELPSFLDLTDDEDAPTFLERIGELFTNKSFYKTALMASIYDIALKDNVVFAGRAAHIVLEDIENVISIQFVAKTSDRIKRLAEAKKISYEDALELIKEKDAEKKEFISYYFDKEIFDPTMFSFVINSSYVKLEDAIELTCNYSKKFFGAVNYERVQEALKNKLVEKKAELLLFKYDLIKLGKIEFEGKDGGKHLIVKGVVGGDEAKESVLNCVKKLKEVEQIEDHLKKGVLSHVIF